MRRGFPYTRARTMLTYQFRPITLWPVTPTRSPRRSQFDTLFSRTLVTLERELAFLSAKNIVLQAYVAEHQIRRDGMLYANANPSRPGVILSFDSKNGPLSYPCDTYDKWQDNVRAITLALEALRSVDRYGVTKRGEQYKGWQALPSPEAATFTPDQARAVIRDVIGAEMFDRMNIEEAIREAVMRSHPDRNGGDAETFKKVYAAKKSLEGK